MYYRAAQTLVRTLSPLMGGVVVDGLERVPRSGAFLMVSNHESFLDPLLIQAHCPRPLHTMAKSTQFADPISRPFLKRLKAFPVRRYQVDPQAVRMTLRRVRQGHGVGIYIEGERTWDGRLLPPRRGTIRLILKAGVPVLPCAISGSYGVLPRWTHRIRRRSDPVRIAIGRPLRFPKMDRRRDREAALDATGTEIMDALRRLRGGSEPELSQADDSSDRTALPLELDVSATRG